MKDVFDLCGFKCRRYDFWHTAVSTALANPDVPIQAAVAYFGLINPKMIGRYYHGVQKESQIVAAALGARKAVQSEKWKLSKRLKQ